MRRSIRKPQYVNPANEVVHERRGHPARHARALDRYLADGVLAIRQIATIMLFDRGYPSLPLLLYLISHHISPVMRVPVSFYPKIIGVAKSNTWITLTLSSAQARQVRAMGVEATAGTVVRLRVITLRLPTGQIETLVTT